ncbi:hypothetical protein NDU88_008960 [Pleurodeles waltl]|uniref:Uncharacterized protein n=1 Tax=Pleurodeles waltl TaxID=8319 RepID=A0AAV7QQ70_PLEWA|nr:hypothetical protein NDU88_008960 [Pleurodeles waltl]
MPGPSRPRQPDGSARKARRDDEATGPRRVYQGCLTQKTFTTPAHLTGSSQKKWHIMMPSRYASPWNKMCGARASMTTTDSKAQNQTNKSFQ